MSAYPPETYDERADLGAHYLFEEFMHELEAEEAERERIIEEEALAYLAAIESNNRRMMLGTGTRRYKA